MGCPIYEKQWGTNPQPLLNRTELHGAAAPYSLACMKTRAGIIDF